MEQHYVYAYPRPAVTVDVVAFAMGSNPRVLLIRRKHDPFAGHWALPGGFVNIDEEFEAAARRELQEETGLDLTDVSFEFLGVWGKPGRDPRGRVISMGYVVEIYGPVPPEVTAADDAVDAAWVDLDTLGAEQLAFDHAEMIMAAMAR